MRIGIIGAGNMGSGFARQLHRTGHDILLGSRVSEHGQEKGRELGVAGGSYRQAVQHGDLVVFAVPGWGVDESLAAAGDLSGKIVVHVTNPYTDASYSRMHEFPGSSGAEQLATKMPGARLVKGWNHIYVQIVHSTQLRRPARDGVSVCR